MQAARARRQLLRRGQPVDLRADLLGLLNQLRHVLTLQGHPVGLLLHGGVEQQDTEHTHGEDCCQEADEHQVTQARRDRPPHSSDDDSNNAVTHGDTPREEDRPDE